MSRTVRMLLIGGCALLGACATMVNRGKVRTVTPADGGPSVRVARVEIKNVRGRDQGLLHFLVQGELTIYDGGRPVEIQSADDGSWRARCRLGARDEVARAACDRAIFWPYIELAKGAPHTLRLVRDDGTEATVEIRARMRPAWIWANAVWFAAAPVGWAVDAVSGRWTYFGPLDVEQVFQRSASASSRSTR